MLRNPYNHIDMRVISLKDALPFYEVLMLELGFLAPVIVREPNGTEWQNFRFAHQHPPSQYLGLTEEPNHQPNNNCVAFYVVSRAEVDRISEVIRAAGGQQIEGPCVCLEYSPEYYAVFFRDPSGNRLEVCHLGAG